MLVQQKKRQSFSIESLAISSHVEGTDRHHRRETDSPYLNYIQSENKQTASVDYNRNFEQPAPVTYNQHYDNQQQSSDAIVNKPTSFGHHVNDNSAPLRIMHPTSTPKMQSNKRKRTCSPQRMSPTSDESCDENMTIDTSSNIDDLSDGKISPISARSLSTMSEGDTESLGDDSDGNKRKKARTAFSGDQLKELERRYKSQKYLTASDRTQLARALKLKDQQVKTWFQNRRMKEKRQQREEENSAGFHLPTGGVDITQLAALGICAPPQSQFLGSSQPLNFNFNSGISPASLDHRLQGQTTTRNGSEPPTQTSPQLSLGRTSPELSTNGGSMFSALDMRAANELRHRSTVAALSPGSMSGVHMPVPIMSQYVMSNMLHSPFSVPLYPH